MKSGKCDICSKESNGLWLINLAQIDSLDVVEGMNIRQSVCKDCVTKLNQVVNSLGNGNPTAMEKAFGKAGVKVEPNQISRPINHANSKDIQNEFLSRLIKNKELVQIEALEGIGWRGFLKSFDNFSLMIAGEHTVAEELVFKHAIKSIKPIK